MASLEPLRAGASIPHFVLRKWRNEVLEKAEGRLGPQAAWLQGAVRMFNQSRRDSFKFEKSRQPFIRTHNEPLSVAAMRVGDPDCSYSPIPGCFGGTGWQRKQVRLQMNYEITGTLFIEAPQVRQHRGMPRF